MATTSLTAQFELSFEYDKTLNNIIKDLAHKKKVKK